jgi:copper resistance protein B
LGCARLVRGDFNRLWAKTEGERLGDRTTGSKVEALWAHAIRPFWDTQLGVRYDFSGGPSREWLAFGVQGISPYWFDIEATGYASDAGRTAARLKAEYDLYLTQRWVLKPEIELNAYGRADPNGESGRVCQMVNSNCAFGTNSRDVLLPI